MSYFPFMIQLDGRQCLIAGGGKVAYRKAHQLLEFGAYVKVVAPDICAELVDLACNYNQGSYKAEHKQEAGFCEAEHKHETGSYEAEHKHEAGSCEAEHKQEAESYEAECKLNIESEQEAESKLSQGLSGKIISEDAAKLVLVYRKISEEDLDDADVVVLATNDSEVNSYYADICKRRHILVNVVDVKKDCGFYFPSIIKQGEVVIGISTGGSSPMLAARIKDDINSNIRQDYGDIARELASKREYALEHIPSEDERRRFFEDELNRIIEAL